MRTLCGSCVTGGLARKAYKTPLRCEGEKPVIQSQADVEKGGRSLHPSWCIELTGMSKGIVWGSSPQMGEFLTATNRELPDIVLHLECETPASNEYSDPEKHTSKGVSSAVYRGREKSLVGCPGV